MRVLEKIKTWWNGLRQEEGAAIEAVRALYQLLSVAPELAKRLFDLLPAILIEMKRLERALPESGRGQERLGSLIQWMEKEHESSLATVASLGETIRATKALATLIVQILKASGMMQR